MRRCILLLALFCLAPAVLRAQPPQSMISYQKLDNQAIMKMVKDGVPDEAIIQEIKTHQGHFDLSAEAVVLLKKAGVSDRVVTAMRDAANAPPKPAPVEEIRPFSPTTPAMVPKPEPAPGASPAPASPPVRTAPQPAPASAPPPPPSPPAAAPKSQPRVEPRPPVSYARTEEREAPRAELFGGLAITRSGAGEGNLTGWNAEVTGNMTRLVGIVGSISSQSESQTFLGYQLGSANVYSLLFGPQFSVRSGRIHGFARGLLGTSHDTLQTRTVDAWAMAYGLGGGLDIGVSSGFAVRVLQWDAIFRNTETGRRTDHRLSLGGVVRF